MGFKDFFKISVTDDEPAPARKGAPALSDDELKAILGDDGTQPKKGPTTAPLRASPGTPAGAAPPKPSGPVMPVVATFSEVYVVAKVPEPPGGVGIAKFLEMIHNPRMAGLTEEVRRSSVVVALEAMGVPLETVIADAHARVATLGDYERWLANKVEEFSRHRNNENAALEREIAAFTAERRARIAANSREVTEAERRLQEWGAARAQEVERLTGELRPFTENAGPSLAAPTNEFGAFKPYQP